MSNKLIYFEGFKACKPISKYIRRFNPYNRIHWDVCIIQILLEFSLTWIWLIWLLAFHMPWDRTDSTFQYPFEKLYKEPIETLKGGDIRENWEYRNYSPLLPELYLSLHPFVPLEHYCVLPKLALVSELAIGVMEDWSGGGPSGGFSFSGSQTCRQRLSLVISDSY